MNDKLKEEIRKTLGILKNGGVILYPTDTIWGLGCDATNPEAVKRIYDIKKRADNKSMLVLLDDAGKIASYADVPDIALDLIEVADKPTTIIYPGAKRLAPNLIAEDDYKRMLVQTLSDRLAEATAEKLHEDVRKKLWGYAPDENLSVKDLHNEKYQGIRPAVGYPSLPDQSVNFLLDELLDMKQIGISLTENGMMKPHASVCGLMFAHPASRYFSIGKIGEDQLADYAARRGMSIEETKKFLAANL